MAPTTTSAVLPHWAPKVPRQLIRRLYESDAQGILDEALIDKVGLALWERCDSILQVTEAHAGRIRCPSCFTPITCENQWRPGFLLSCTTCGWELTWTAYHRTYRGKQLFGANAVSAISSFHAAFPKSPDARNRMLLIDQILHAFHLTLTEVGRPVAANLIEGSLGDVIHFLDQLSSSTESASRLGDSHTAWRTMLNSAPWTAVFVKKETAPDR